MDLGLNDVHVLVTGASGGIGLATCELFLKQGARVTAHYNTNATSLEPLLAEYGPSRIRTVQADLSDEDDVILMFIKEDEEFGSVQVLVVNHGYYPPLDVTVSEMTLEQWNSTITSNLTSSFLVVKEYLKHLERATIDEKDKANIVFVGSTSGKYGEAGHGDYSAAKSGIMYGLTKTLKNEIVKIAPLGRVNCIAPGWVKTPMTAQALEDPEVVYRALATMPLKKLATPEDIATQIVFVSSSTVSGHVSGQVIMVEGGMEGRLLNKPEEIVYE
ncbi:NAD(P)-binding protein [Laetiporus sulphureus 93-53]|uniref:NAD(P)-binding protein n=1 Tax=Laetiporus sulphureus 93-53 TaxID=1314785 RepID=A0A165B6R6_9APHY|nr:NAD(P)-binding protein [Laetiporus sulphureus 93-53]KZT00370.1 NAD(P)-binding protein [Laetiporus sulphureus 93-53]